MCAITQPKTASCNTSVDNLQQHWYQQADIRVTLVIFTQFSPTCASSYCQRTPHKKYAAANETQRFRFFIRSPLENFSPRTGRKLSEYDRRGCVRMACESLLTTSLLQVFKTLVASQLSKLFIHRLAASCFKKLQQVCK